MLVDIKGERGHVQSPNLYPLWPFSLNTFDCPLSSKSVVFTCISIALWSPAMKKYKKFTMPQKVIFLLYIRLRKNNDQWWVGVGGQPLDPIIDQPLHLEIFYTIIFNLIFTHATSGLGERTTSTNHECVPSFLFKASSCFSITLNNTCVYYNLGAGSASFL